MSMKMLFGYNFGKLSIAVIPLSQAKADKEDWQEVDLDELSPEIRKAYEEYKASYKVTKGHREYFEAVMRGMADIHTPVKAKAAKVARPSLAEYLANANGRAI